MTTATGQPSTPVDVLIVGAGPVGLACAIELGSRGIRCLVIERNDRVGYAPRAKTTNVRTREHLRRWGIADALRAASPMSADYPSDVVFATRMNGHLLAKFENALHGRQGRNNLYAEEAQWVPQYVLEEVLRRHAASLPGVDIAFRTQLASCIQDAEGVTATVATAPDGSRRDQRARYMIGCDGARSIVRDAIGSRMEGDGGFSQNFNVIFRAPELSRRHALGRAIMYWMVNDDVPSLLGPMDEEGLWFFMATKLKGDVDPASVDPIDLVRRGTGISDLAMDVVGTDPWVAHRLVADRYATGRIFLAGDACHLHPPFGGFGMNMGIGDAVDLGWKLAATLKGWGGPELLASYEAERRPVHMRTIAEAVVNYSAVGNQLVRAGIEDATETGEATRREVGEIIESTKLREFKTLGIVLGARYDASPITVDDGSLPPVDHHMIYIPSAHPGCRAPHLWLEDGTSLYDRFGPDFTLLVTYGLPRDAAAFTESASVIGMPLAVVAPGDARLRDRYEARFALIRPDQHVAWRGDEAPSDVIALLRHVSGHGTTERTRAEQAA
jgi:2-polyprenyl-6-methoxyphenol hydroxylase-like FAD-dependent oxidoreductase